MSQKHRPRMSPEQAELIRRWHEESHAELRARLPADIMFMSLHLRITENVLVLDESAKGDPYHRAVAGEVGPGMRVLDMGTGSGVSALLAARAGSDVVAVDINPEAVACALANAEENGLSDRINFVHADLFDGVEGDFDRIIFDPPFRWFEPRDLLEGAHTDGDYQTLTRFMAEAPTRLRPNGRIVMNFGTSGDLDYLRELIGRSGLVAEETQYGETTKLGYTAEYYVIRLFHPAAAPRGTRSLAERHDPDMTFDSLRERILDLYGNKRYEEALSLVQTNVASFPDHRATSNYWIACFLALVGRDEESIACLESGLAEGSWWAEPVLRGDPDLESVRSMQRFQRLTEESANRWKASAEGDGPPVVVPADGEVRATLVVLQGGEGPASEVADQWRTASTLGCTIVVPGRGQFINSDRDARNWFDERETDARVADAVRLAATSAPLVLAGFSAGGREAIRIAAAGSPAVAAGVLLFGPGKPRSKLDLDAAKERGLRVWTFVGEDDWMLSDVIDLDGWIREAGIPLVEDRVPGMGHLVPDDLPERLPAMLDAVLPARGAA